MRCRHECTRCQDLIRFPLCQRGASRKMIHEDAGNGTEDTEIIRMIPE